MEKPAHILIDANNLFWRCMSTSLTDYIRYDGIQIYAGGIAKFFSRVKEIQKAHARANSVIYFLFDNPFSQINIRKIISEGKYKHIRKSKQVPKDMYRSLTLLIEILRNHSDNFRVVQSASVEADDLTYPILKSIKPSKQNTVLCVSADLDWARNITSDVSWFNYSKVYTPESFKKDFGFKPTNNAVKLYKAIRGDHSDNIDVAIPHMPTTVLLHIVEHYDDASHLIQEAYKDAHIPDQWKQKIKDFRTELSVNYQLVDFVQIERDISEYTLVCKRDGAQVRLWFNILGLPLESWMQTKINLRKNFFKKKKNRI